MPTATDTSDHNLADRYPTDDAGRNLIAIMDAALPIAGLSVTALVQERKRIPLLDEFVLRLAKADVTSVSDMSGVLGLDEPMVSQAIAGQLSEGNLQYRHNLSASVQLTARGQSAAIDLASVRPQRRTLPCFYDRLASELHPCDESDLLFRHEIEDLGLLELPAEPGKAITEADVSPAALNRFLGDISDDSADLRLEVINIRKINVKRVRRFRPVRLLVFADTTLEDVNLAVVIDNEISPSHQRALAKLGGAAALGIKIDEPAERPRLDDELEQLRAPTTASPSTLAAEPPIEQLAADTGPEVRALTVFEHPAHLDTALTMANRRLLIISPWLRREVITTDFLGKLEGRLRRSVSVHIAHGYQDDPAPSDVVSRLNNLTRRYPKLFTFTRITNTHAKILIYDDVWITTSFNWLSFRGDPNRTYRMEEGTLVRDQTLVTTQYERLVQQIHDEAQS
ncbi:hypothetical protein GCM10009850_111570 [Nonomuraea monospora]|uniref:Phospholipase D-like domain-containing protein n=2 Tax=Nonomuraea monospora TaxID=568818 RepID=A0ABP5PVC9_9ACTN